MADTFDGFTDEDEGDEGQSTEGQSSAIKQIRDQLNAEKKARKAEAKELADLRAFRAELDARTKTETTSKQFEEMGLDPRHAKLFYAANGADAEPSAEAVAKFALDFGLGVAAGSQEALEAAAEGPKFVPLTPGGSAPVKDMLTRAQYNELRRTDMAAAVQAVQDHRVEGFNYDVEVKYSR